MTDLINVTRGLPTQGIQCHNYRVVLVLPGKRLCVKRDDCGIHLPQISIPCRRRPAEELTTYIQQNWNIVSVMIDTVSSNDERDPCAVIEALSCFGITLPPGVSLLSSCEINNLSLTPIEIETVEQILAGNTGDRGPFSRIGWVAEATEWIYDSVRPRNIRFTGSVRQLNATGTFAALRFDTTEAPAYWLKATGTPNTHEFAVTTALARYFPDYLPPFVAARQDWNAWVTEDFGVPLSTALDTRTGLLAVNALASLQRDSVGKMNQLLAVGCVDTSLDTLVTHLGPLFEYLGDAMLHQSSTRVAPITFDRLEELYRIVRDASDCMQSLKVPDSLVHNDANLGNILVDGDSCVITDWAEAGVGNPFLTFQYLLVQFVRRAEETRIGVRVVIDAYRELWRDVLPEVCISRALILAPLLTVAHHLIGRGAWLTNSEGRSSSFDSYARSLARHMDREASQPALLEVLCR